MKKQKTKQLLVYIVSKHFNVSVTGLMKLSYLIDLISVKRHKKQVSCFEYQRYFFGPFDDRIYTLLNELVDEKVVLGEQHYTFENEEYLVYLFNNEKEDFTFKDLTRKDKEIIDEVLEQLKGYGAKALTDITYETPPMKKLGATQGGNENMRANLVLNSD